MLLREYLDSDNTPEIVELSCCRALGGSEKEKRIHNEGGASGYLETKYKIEIKRKSVLNKIITLEDN